MFFSCFIGHLVHSICIRPVEAVASVALAVLICGCSDAHDGNAHKAALSATATVSNVDGRLVKQTPSSGDVERIQALEAKLAEIDAKYPPSRFDPKAELNRVVEVRRDGVLLLDGGVALKFAGIECSSAGIANITKILLDDSARVAFKAASERDSPIPAEVWLVDVSNPTSPRYSLIAETALKSGWCEPDQTTAMLYPRYVALAALSN